MGTTEFRHKILKATTPAQLRILLGVAERHIELGCGLPWLALAESWQADAKLIEGLLAATLAG